MAADTVSPLESTIEQHLDSTSRLVRHVDLALSLLIVSSLLLAGLFLAILADHWLLQDGLSLTLRFGIFFVLFAIAGFYIYRKVVPLFLYPINPVYTADLIEKETPAFKNSLINWLLLRHERQERTEQPQDRIGERMYDGIVQTAAVNVQTVPTEHPVDFSNLVRITTLFVFLLALFIGYAALSPKSPLASLARVLIPFSGIERPQAAQFRNIKPGNASALQGETLTISAEVVSKSPDDVYLVFSTDDGQAVGQRIPMHQPEGKIAFETLFPPGKQGTERGFNSSVDYWIAQGESRSKQYRIDVLPAASIEIVSLQYKFPAYTGLEPELVEHSGDVKALEGTEVSVAVRSTLPLQSIDLVFDDRPAGKVAMNILGDQKTEAKGTFVLKSPFPYKSFAFQATDTNGNVSRRSGIYQIEVIPDEPPQVQWADTAAHLTNARIDVPVNETLQLPIQAEDPDFALRYLQFKTESMTNKQIRFPEIPLLESPATGPTEHKGQITKAVAFSPEKSRLNVGDSVEVWVEAKDTKYPEANTGSTVKLTINVAEAKKEEEKKDPEQEQTADGEQQAAAEGEQSPDEPKNGESNQDQANQDEPDQAESKEGEQGESEQKNGEKPNEQQPKPNQSEKGNDSQQEKNPEQNPQEQKPQQQNNEQQSGEGQKNNQGGASGDQPQEPKDGEEGSNKGAAGDEPSEKEGEQGNESAGGEEEPADGGEQTAAEGGEETADGRRQTAAEGEKPNGESQGQNQSAGDSEGQNKEGNQSGGKQSGGNQSGGKGQSPGEGKPETPVNPETQDGDAMERIVEQMKKEKKFDESQMNSGQNKNNQNQEGNGQKGNSQEGNSQEGNKGQGNSPNQRTPQGQADGETKRMDSPMSGMNEKLNNDNSQRGTQDQSGDGKETADSRRQTAAEGEMQNGDSQGSESQGSESQTASEASNQSSGTNTGQQGEGQQGEGQQGQQGAGQSGKQGQPSDAGQPQSGEGGTSGSGSQGSSPSAQTPEQTPPQTPKSSPQDPNQEGQGSQQTGGTGGGSGGETPTAVDDPNLEYADKVTNLVLEYLEDQLKEEPNDELLQKLGWSEDQLRQFYEKWQKMANEQRVPQKSEGKNPWAESLKSLGLKPNRERTALQKNQTTVKDKGRVIESQRFEPPPGLREQYKRYTEGIGK